MPKKTGKRSDLDDMLLAYAAGGDATKVKALLEEGADVNARDYRSFTPLHNAAGVGAADVVDLLLRAGADPSALNTYKATALHEIAAGGGGADDATRARVVNSLLDAGCQVDDNGVMHRAAAAGNIAVVRALLARGAKVGAETTALNAARENEHTEIEALLAERMRELGVEVPPVKPIHPAADAEQQRDAELKELQSFLQQTIEDLKRASGSKTKLKRAIERYLKQGEALGRQSEELWDYFAVSSPTLAAEAGFDEAEEEQAIKLFERLSNQRK